MIKLIRKGVYYMEGKIVKEEHAFMTSDKKEKAVRSTVTYSILRAHGAGKGETVKLKFDELVSSDANYFNILGAVKACRIESFSVPYTLIDCRNALCAQNGTTGADLHRFGLSAAKKYGGNYVPAYLATANQYMRECRIKCGGMVLGSDKNTRYGALGALGVCEDDGELVKQLLGQTYDVPRPEVIAVHLKGKLRKGVGPLDVALAMIAATHKSGFLKDKILEFVGAGVSSLSMDYRIGIDEMATETGCLSSVWETDEKTEEYFTVHGREGDYKKLRAEQPAFYDGALVVDLSDVEPMIALPFKNYDIYTLRDLLSRPEELLQKVEEEGKKKNPDFKITDKIVKGKVLVDQALVTGIGGSYENLAECAEIMRDGSVGAGSYFGLYPASQSVLKCLAENGYLSLLLEAGASVHAPSGDAEFGGADTPFDNALSIRHAARNFAYCEGGMSAMGQLGAVMLMDARSIAATAASGGVLTSALDFEYAKRIKKYKFDLKPYASRVYQGGMKPDTKAKLIYGANLSDCPAQPKLSSNLLIRLSRVCKDGELDEFPAGMPVCACPEIETAPEEVLKALGISSPVGFGNAVAAQKIGVADAVATVCKEYTARSLKKLVNRGVVPFLAAKIDFNEGDYLYIAELADYVKRGESRVVAKLFTGKKTKDIVLELPPFSKEEQKILLAGGLVNFLGAEE